MGTLAPANYTLHYLVSLLVPEGVKIDADPESIAPGCRESRIIAHVSTQLFHSRALHGVPGRHRTRLLFAGVACRDFQEFLFGGLGPLTPVQFPGDLGKVAIQFHQRNQACVVQ